MPDLQLIGEIIQEDLNQVLNAKDTDDAFFRPLVKGEFGDRTIGEEKYVIITWEKFEDGNMEYSRTPLTREEINKFAADKEFIHSEEAKKIFEKRESVFVAMQENVEVIAELDTAQEENSLN